MCSYSNLLEFLNLFSNHRSLINIASKLHPDRKPTFGHTSGLALQKRFENEQNERPEFSLIIPRCYSLEAEHSCSSLIFDCRKYTENGRPF